MELWGWLVAYVLLFICLHLVLYVYYQRQDGDDRLETPSIADGSLGRVRHARPIDGIGTNDDHESEPEVSDPDEYDGHGGFAAADEWVACSRCGAPNEADPTFTFCWNCVKTLGR